MAWHRSIIWTNSDLVYWHIYAALGEDELTNGGQDQGPSLNSLQHIKEL